MLLLLLLPLVGIFIISSRSFATGDLHSNEIKFIGLATTIVNLLISLVVWLLFDFSSNQFQFVQECYESSQYSIYLGVDGISMCAGRGLLLERICPFLIVYSLEFHLLIYCIKEHLYKLRPTTLLASNKRLLWIAGRERSRQSGLPSIIARASRSEHAEVNELDTHKRDKSSGHILSRIRRCV